MSADTEAMEAARRIVELTPQLTTWPEGMNGLAKDAMAVARALLQQRESINQMAEALRGVIRVADRKTVEFDAARDALALAEGILEFGSEEAWRAAMGELRNKMLATVEAHMAVPTPDPAVMRDYIVKLTSYWMDNSGWTELANEARGYVGALAARKETPHERKPE